MKKLIFVFVASIYGALAFGQDSLKTWDKVFEEAKQDPAAFTKMKVRVGADFALQFQSLQHHADSLLIPLGGNINLPTANMTIESDLAPGIKVNLVTYLSARHHNEAWVKGGYLLVDALPFFKSKVVDNIMKYMTLKVGVMELNYGDDHFYRSDNGRVINNPFVGNYILDGFTTAPAAELYFRWKGINVMAAATSGGLKPALGGYNTTTKSWDPYNMGREMSYYFKLAYDKKLTDKIRIRPAVSGYLCSGTHGGTLYAGDRAGSRYYLVMNKQSLGTSPAYDITANVTNGYFGPGSFTKNTSIMGNLYAWIYGFELFGTYEVANGNTGFEVTSPTGVVTPVRKYSFTHMNVQGLYYFGGQKQFYVGGRYGIVTRNATDAVGTVPAMDKMSTNRIQAAAGWKITPNIIAKVEYVIQDYKNFNKDKTGYANYGPGAAGFKGLMVEAGISF